MCDNEEYRYSLSPTEEDIITLQNKVERLENEVSSLKKILDNLLDSILSLTNKL